MPLLRSLLGQRAIKSTDMPFDQILTETGSSTGKRVSPHQSLRVAAVYAGVRLIAESVSSLPADLIKSTGNRRQVQDGPLAELLTEAPNPEQDAPELWRTVMGWMLLEGNAYLYVERNASGVPIGLWPIPATYVEVGRTGGRRLYYDLNLTDLAEVGAAVPPKARVGAESVLHYKAFGTGLYGLSPIRQVREAVATSLSAQEYMGRFYKQDASPGGVLTTDGNLSDEQFDRLQTQWKASHGGVERSHLLAILEGGTKWESVGLNPQDAAFIETQKWETVEIARALGVPPHMIGDVERSTSWGSGIAEQGIGFVTYTLTPWITRLEWVARRGLLRELDPLLRLKWRVDGLQRGDTKSRYEAYAVGRNWGWLSTNDVRTLEDMDPVEGGDVYLQPLNMVPADTFDTDDTDPPPTARGRRSSLARRRIAERFAPLIADADGRVAKVEQSEVDRLVRIHLDDEGGSPQAFIDAVEQLYGSTVADRAEKAFGPIFTTFAAEVADEAADEVGGEAPNLDRWVQAYVASHVAYRVGAAAAKLRRLASQPDAATAVRAKLDGWVAERPAKTARWEATQLSRATARETWRNAGVRELRWVASGSDQCPLCVDLDGKVVGVEQAFVQKGETVPGGADQEPLTAGRNTFHPPLHPGCECDLVPG